MRTGADRGTSVELGHLVADLGDERRDCARSSPTSAITPSDRDQRHRRVGAELQRRLLHLARAG